MLFQKDSRATFHEAVGVHTTGVLDFLYFHIHFNQFMKSLILVIKADTSATITPPTNCWIMGDQSKEEGEGEGSTVAVPVDVVVNVVVITTS